MYIERAWIRGWAERSSSRLHLPAPGWCRRSTSNISVGATRRQIRSISAFANRTRIPQLSWQCLLMKLECSDGNDTSSHDEETFNSLSLENEGYAKLRRLELRWTCYMSEIDNRGMSDKSHAVFSCSIFWSSKLAPHCVHPESGSRNGNGRLRIGRVA